MEIVSLHSYNCPTKNSAIDHTRRIVYDLSVHPAISPNASAGLVPAILPSLRSWSSPREKGSASWQQSCREPQGIHRDVRYGWIEGRHLALPYQYP